MPDQESQHSQGGRRATATPCTAENRLAGARRFTSQRPDPPSRSQRLVRMGLMFLVVLAVAALIGRVGSGIDDGPAVDVDQSREPAPARAPRSG